jgi:hypothetical protein
VNLLTQGQYLTSLRQNKIASVELLKAKRQEQQVEQERQGRLEAEQQTE